MSKVTDTNPRGAGRKLMYEGESERMRTHTVRLTRWHIDKLERLGGAVWLREKIEKAPEPK